MKLSYLFLALSQISIGISFAFSSIAFQQIPVLLYSGIAMTAACIIQLPFLFFTERVNWLKLSKGTYFRIFMQGLSGCFLLTIFAFYGLSYTSATAGGIITSILPAVILILSFFIYREKLSFRKITSIIFAVIGVGILNTVTTADSGTGSTFFGNILMVLSVLSQAIFTLYSRKIATDLPPFASAFAVNAVAAILFIPLAIWSGMSLDWQSVTATNWFLNIGSGLFGGVLAITFWYIGIKKVPGSKAGIFTCFLPITTLVLSVTLSHETVGLIHIVALCCVILSIVLGVIDKDGEQNVNDSSLTNIG